MADIITIDVTNEPTIVTLGITSTPDEVVVGVSEVGQKGDPGNPGEILTIQVVASATILKYDFVNADGTKADSAVITKRGWLIGMASANIAIGFSGPLLWAGEVSNPAWTWVVGNILYLNGSSLSTVPPSSGFIQRVAVAKTETIIELDFSVGVLL